MSKTAKISGLLLIFALSAALFPDIVQPGFAQTIGNAERGFGLARGQCAECHAVRPAELFSPNSAAPSFERIAGVLGISVTAIKVMLRSSHATMPNVILNEDETNDVVAYILSLPGEK